MTSAPIAATAETRYQVFVSSTFTDLREARQQVVQALLQLDCLPAGMELFPASDKEQWQFIKKVIDDSDYYILLLAGRYGSTTAEGVSYTEQEFDYAVERGVPILAFVHGDPESIPIGQSELAPEARKRLAEFREKVIRDRLVKEWRIPAELPGLVAFSLTKLFKTSPALGWTRGSSADTLQLLQQLNDLRQRKDEMEERLSALAAAPSEVTSVAHGAETIKLYGTYKRSYSEAKRSWSFEVTWNQILFNIGPELLQWQNDSSVNSELAKAVLCLRGLSPYEARVDHEIFKTIRLQFLALHYVELQTLPTRAGGTALFWRLTARGRAQLLELRTVRSTSSERGPSSTDKVES